MDTTTGRKLILKYIPFPPKTTTTKEIIEKMLKNGVRFAPGLKKARGRGKIDNMSGKRRSLGMFIKNNVPQVKSKYIKKDGTTHKIYWREW